MIDVWVECLLRGAASASRQDSLALWRVPIFAQSLLQHKKQQTCLENQLAGNMRQSMR